MKKQIKLKATETSATNRDFYNLFRPIAPSIDMIGKVAQVISGLTEAITIWHITQSEMAGASKAVSIIVSIIATLLLVSILEIGGRKFLQVLTRAIVWKRLKNAWYVGLFAIVSFITIGIAVLSFRLSTNGIRHTFTSNVPVVSTVDASDLKTTYRSDVKDISLRFDDELKLIKENHQDILSSTSEKYDAQIREANLQADKYESKYRKGEKWAKGHIEKHRKKTSQLQIQKANALIALNEGFTKKSNTWQLRKNESLDTEKSQLNGDIASRTSVVALEHQSKKDNANFWGNLFSFLVGFSVVLAFICIITVEVYRRGCGIQVEYQEEDLEPSVLGMFWKGMVMRTSGYFRAKAEKFSGAQASYAIPNTNRSIGFNTSKSFLNGQNEDSLPSDSLEDFDQNDVL